MSWRTIACAVLLLISSTVAYAQSNPTESWRKQLAARLEENKRQNYQRLAGNVTVAFLIDRAGKLVSSWLEESSGIRALDEDALAVVERSQPFPVPPPELEADRTPNESVIHICARSSARRIKPGRRPA